MADTDQTIVSGRRHSSGHRFSSCAELFADHLLETLHTMAGIQRKDASSSSDTLPLDSDIFVALQLTGALSGTVCFGFSRELALGMIRSMTMIEDLDEIDVLALSALSELGNIACGNAASEFAARGMPCDTRPPLSLKLCRIRCSTQTQFSIKQTPVSWRSSCRWSRRPLCNTRL